jgi:hypothetical protein
MVSSSSLTMWAKPHTASHGIQISNGRLQPFGELPQVQRQPKNVEKSLVTVET